MQNLAGNPKAFADTASGMTKNPLGIIGLFIVLIYGFASMVVGFSSNLEARDMSLLIKFLIIFPVGVLFVFYWLVSKHHYKLYGPSEYQKQEIFASTFPNIEYGALGDPSKYVSERLSEKIKAPTDMEVIDMAQSKWSQLINDIPVENLLILYGRYDEKRLNTLALQTSYLAIAKGANYSKNYSFASASLRKLGRYLEAKAFAELALDIAKNNIDANYNLALIYNSLGDLDKATMHANKVLKESQDEHHKARIRQEFLDLHV